MSMFDKDTFLTQEVEDSMSTKFNPMPEHEADAYISKVELKSGTIKKGDRAGETWVMLNLTWVIESEEAKAATNMDEPKVTQAVFLDLTEDGLLDTAEGRNINLGRIREAVGQNEAGVWSPQMLEGQPAHVYVTQRADESDSTKIYNDIKTVTAR